MLFHNYQHFFEIDRLPHQPFLVFYQVLLFPFLISWLRVFLFLELKLNLCTFFVNRLILRIVFDMRFLYLIARSAAGRFFIGWIFAHMSFAIPVNRLYETETMLAFRHPKPGYPVHILLVPKKAIPALSDLKEEDNAFLRDVFQVVQSLVKDLDLGDKGYRLILNCGQYQEVPQLHFHLISGEAVH